MMFCKKTLHLLVINYNICQFFFFFFSESSKERTELNQLNFPFVPYFPRNFCFKVWSSRAYSICRSSWEDYVNKFLNSSIILDRFHSNKLKCVYVMYYIPSTHTVTPSLLYDRVHSKYSKFVTFGDYAVFSTPKRKSTAFDFRQYFCWYIQCFIILVLRIVKL